MRKKLAVILCLFGVANFLGTVPASEVAESFVLGQHYEAVTPVQPVQTQDKNKIEVLEIFWYGCPHCNDFEPYINKWLATKPSDVEFRRMPAVFRKDWLVHARAYYTAEALGVLDQIHAPLFKALHQDKRKLGDEASLAEFFAEHGVSKEQFSNTFSSFAVDSKVRQAIHMVQQYGITGVPAIIVNGKYRISTSMAKTYDTLLKVIDYLVDKERQRLVDRQ